MIHDLPKIIEARVLAGDNMATAASILIAEIEQWTSDVEKIVGRSTYKWRSLGKLKNAVMDWENLNLSNLQDMKWNS